MTTMDQSLFKGALAKPRKSSTKGKRSGELQLVMSCAEGEYLMRSRVLVGAEKRCILTFGVLGVLRKAIYDDSSLFDCAGCFGTSLLCASGDCLPMHVRNRQG